MRAHQPFEEGTMNATNEPVTESREIPGTEPNGLHDAPPSPEVATGRFAVPWKTRIKLAIALSFVVLVGIQIAGKFRPEKPAAKEPQADSARTSPTLAIHAEEGTPPSAAEGDSARESNATVERTALVRPQENTRENQSGIHPLMDLTSDVETPPTPSVGEVTEPALSSSVVDEPTPGVSGSSFLMAQADIANPTRPVGGLDPFEKVAEQEPPTPSSARRIIGALPEIQDEQKASEAVTKNSNQIAAPASTIREVGVAASAAVPISPRNLTLATPPATMEVAGERSAKPPVERANRGATAPVDLVGGRIEAITHVVRRGENFWTIARHYYGSGRFYRALWKANEDRVPRIDELYIGSPILVPAPEDLDRSMIDPPSRGASRSSPSETNRGLSQAAEKPQKDGALERTAASSRSLFDVEDPKLAPAERLHASPSEETTAETPNAQTRTYVTKRGETLRGIAARELGDARLDEELLRRNSQVVDDPFDIPAGTTLELPRRTSK
jgi:nucleoid-associated protein YgaU